MIITNRRTLHVVDARHCLVRNIAVVGDNVLVSQIFYVSLPVPNDHSRHRAATQHREMIESLYTHHKAPVRPSVRLSVCLSVTCSSYCVTRISCRRHMRLKGKGKGSPYSIYWADPDYRSWSRFSAVSLQVTWVINPAIGCRYFPPGPQLPSKPLRGLLPVSLLGEQRHDGCEQFA